MKNYNFFPALIIFILLLLGFFVFYSNPVTPPTSSPEVTPAHNTPTPLIVPSQGKG